MNDQGYGAGTHVGYVRQHNEDYYAADCKHNTWLIADGMGGRQAGEVASKIVAETILAGVNQEISVTEAITRSHQAVIDTLRQGKGAPGMGSTVVVLKMDHNNYEIAWVGDSRAYLWGNGTLRPLTRDHSVVQYLLDAGVINSQEAAEHPKRSQLTQALGPLEITKLDIATAYGKLHPGEQILLCSDGLTTELSEKQIEKILAQKLNVQEKVDRLIQAALNAGGHDNITVLLIPAKEQVVSNTIENNIQPDPNVRLGQDTQPIPILPPGTPSHRWIWMWTALLLITIVVLTIVAWWLTNQI